MTPPTAHCGRARNRSYTLRAVRTTCALCLALVLAATGCRPSPSEAPRLVVGPTPSDDPPAGAPTEAVAAAIGEGWFDVDQLPAGAMSRLGSRALLGESAIAIADDGTVATYHRDLGVVEYRLDGKARVLDLPGCQPSVLRYVGGVLHGICHKRRFRGHAGNIEVFEAGCAGDLVALSPDTSSLACADTDTDTDTTVVAVHTAGHGPTRTTIPGSFRELVVGDDGIAYLSDGAHALVAVAKGKIRWRAKGEHHHVAVDPAAARLVTWDERARTFSILGAATGKRSRTIRPDGIDVMRPIQIVPDGRSWLALVYASPPALLQLEPARASVLASWPVGAYTHAVAISPSARFAAALDDRILRVNLSDPHAEQAVTAASTESVAGITSTHDGRRLALARADGTLEVHDPRTGEALARGRGPEGILRGVPMAFSPDQSRLAVANAYGELVVLDADTLAVSCRIADEASVPATWLFWGDGGVVAVFGGNPADDEQYVSGGITIVDERCRVSRTLAHDSLVEVFDVDAGSVLVAMLDENWQMRGPKAKVERVDLRKGTISEAPAAAHAAARASQAASEAGETTPAKSIDGSTRLEVVEDDSDGAPGRRVTCRDAATNEVLREHTLPPSAWEEITPSADGSWFAVTEGPTVLVYPCR